MPTAITLEHPAEGVTVVRLDRPRRLNAIDQDLRDELLDALAGLSADAGTRVVVLTGSGRGFCAGLDIKGFGPSAPGADDAVIDRLAFQESMAALPLAVRALPQPVIAAVNGPAVGAGMSLALAADIRVAGRSASFGNGAILLGLSGAEMGMSYFLPRMVGPSVAADWMLTGRTVGAEEAHRWGLVSELHDDDALLDGAVALASQIAANTRLGVQLTKRALQANVDAPDLATALELENRNQVLTHAEVTAAAARLAER